MAIAFVPTAFCVDGTTKGLLPSKQLTQFAAADVAADVEPPGVPIVRDPPTDIFAGPTPMEVDPTPMDVDEFDMSPDGVVLKGVEYKLNADDPNRSYWTVYLEKAGILYAHHVYMNQHTRVFLPFGHAWCVQVPDSDFQPTPMQIAYAQQAVRDFMTSEPAVCTFLAQKASSGISGRYIYMYAHRSAWRV